jgi:putative DNA primase/helicase
MSEITDLIKDRFTELNTGYKFATYEDTGKIMVYIIEDGIYKDAEPLIIKVACQGDIFLTPSALATIKLNIKGRSYKVRHTNNDKICLNNGILTFSGGRFVLSEHTPDEVFESKVLIDYKEGASCPVWIETLNRMLPDINDQLLLQEWFGYHFLPGQLYEKAMFLTGKPSTGKSTTIYVLNQLIGGCCAHHQLSEFQDDKDYAIADLYNKLGNTYTDMGNSVIDDVGKFKVLTGSNDTVTSRFPYERPFNFINPAKITLASNRLPPLSANVQGDTAWWKRVLLLQYSVVVTKKTDGLFDKLKAELSGILNWSLEGYTRLINNNGEFTKNTNDNYESWTHSAYSENPLQEFLDEKCMFAIDCWCECNVLRNKYSVWCTEHLEIPISVNEFRSALVLKGIFESRKLMGDTGKREHIYKGIAIIS